MNARTPWLIFVGALLIVIAVMGAVTAKIVALQSERDTADRNGALQEQVRLALWSLDSETTPLLMEEIAALGLLGDPISEQALPPVSGHVNARFVIEGGGDTLRIVGDTDTDTDTDANTDTDTDTDTDTNTNTNTNGHQQRLSALLHPATLRTELPDPIEVTALALVLDTPLQQAEAQRSTGTVQTKGNYSPKEHDKINANELARRVQTVSDNLNRISNPRGYGSLGNSFGSLGIEGTAPEPPGPVGAVRPMWVGDELFLLRRARSTGADPDATPDAIHGVWLDWPALRAHLLTTIDPWLPTGELLAVPDGHGPADNLLATLPVQLIPGAPKILVTRDASVVPLLALAWTGVLVAIVGVFGVLRWSMALSERRAEFVSTVTHELRTPLTTFRMYTEMLQGGMVDEAKRSRYLSTLRREADRLGELVENVLTYARIESDRVPLTPEVLSVGALLDRVRDRLEQRAEAAGLELNFDIEPERAEDRVRVDPAAAEQIFFNLVDNAAKYGPSESAPRIDIRARDAGGRVAISVRDYGPGISDEDRKRIFEPFAKAKADQSGTQPGVGLGLALCRRLARQLGGDITVEQADPGARFLLTLPRGTDPRD